MKKGSKVLARLREAERWDAANYNPADRGLWDRVDSMSFNAAASPQSRRTARNRARYLVANNAYAAGAASAIVAAVAGTAPRLQLADATSNRETLALIENDFGEWSAAVGLDDKLRAMRHAKFVDGESFAILYNNPKLTLTSGVMLDVRPIDCDRVTAAYASLPDPLDVDGVLLDKFGDVVSYRVLNYNPGDVGIVANIDDATVYPAINVCHWYRQQYPEQVRGYSELAPALELFMLIDRYSKAVVQASETAADLAMVFMTDSQELDGADNIDDKQARRSIVPEDKPFVQIPWMRGMTMTIPEGWDVKQLSAEQPSNSYGMLVDEILAQIGAAINVPKLLMKNSAENYNYSSARVDLQNFQNAVRLDRVSMRQHVLDPIWRAWYAEYRAINGLKINPCVTWYFDGFFHVDPLKEANAQIARVNAGLSSLAAEYGAKGQDWERELQQIARERSYVKELEEEYGVKLFPTNEEKFDSSDDSRIDDV